MKPLFTLFAIGLLTACVSNTEYDRDRAYTKCESISDESSRNRCIADAIQEAERDRHNDAQRLEQFEDNAERRELGREIAGAEDD
ncbi:MAG: hypothetical protein AAFR82_08340 [Pseudomonadota bacterium]